jgi:hypothetical protein
MNSTPADNKLKAEHLLNFVVNSLDEEFSLVLGDNVEVTAEKLYEVLAGASTGGSLFPVPCSLCSISRLLIESSVKADDP